MTARVAEWAVLLGDGATKQTNEQGFKKHEKFMSECTQHVSFSERSGAVDKKKVKKALRRFKAGVLHGGSWANKAKLLSAQSAAKGFLSPATASATPPKTPMANLLGTPGAKPPTR